MKTEAEVEGGGSTTELHGRVESKAQSTIYSQMHPYPQFLLYRLHQRHLMICKRDLERRWGGWKSDLKTWFLALTYTADSIQSRIIRSYQRCLMLNTIVHNLSLSGSRLLSLCHPLHFAYSICQLLPWVMISFCSEKQRPIYLKLEREKEK